MNLRGWAAAAALSLTTGCAMWGGPVDLSASPSMPAAEGSVRFGVTKNDNTSIILRVKHLAHPERLTPPAGNYVVWTKANKDAAPQNIGTLKVDSDLVGSLLAETPLKSFDLFITAEAAGGTQQPAGTQLLWTSFSR